jgi:hypothetical protein
MIVTNKDIILEKGNMISGGITRNFRFAKIGVLITSVGVLLYGVGYTINAVRPLYLDYKKEKSNK